MSASRLDADSSEDELAGGRSHVLDDSSDSSVGRPDDMDFRDGSGDETEQKKNPAATALNADSSDDDVPDTRQERYRNELPVTYMYLFCLSIP
jgi:hypothetical protein